LYSGVNYVVSDAEYERKRKLRMIALEKLEAILTLFVELVDFRLKRHFCLKAGDRNHALSGSYSEMLCHEPAFS
jgi:hypothetical protein